MKSRRAHSCRTYSGRAARAPLPLRPYRAASSGGDPVAGACAEVVTVGGVWRTWLLTSAAFGERERPRPGAVRRCLALLLLRSCIALTSGRDRIVVTRE